MNDDEPATDLAATYAYHQRTRHAFHRAAAGPGHMDWDTQPDPFRRYAGAPIIELPLESGMQSALYRDLFLPQNRPPQRFNRATLGCLLELSLGLAAWKSHAGDRWALRCNPSSGNLHPTEGYAISSGCEGLADGIYHYVSHDHALEQRCALTLPFQGLLIGLTAIHWREAWKYGERAFRYCQHDAGHALAALRYAAGIMGWSVELLDDWGDADVARLLGLDRDRDFGPAEREAPDLLCRILPVTSSRPVIDTVLGAVEEAIWHGRANTLSHHHLHQWPAIDTVHHSTNKPRTTPHIPQAHPLPDPIPTRNTDRAATLIRQRRSAQAFDGITSIPRDLFFRILDATLPRSEHPPFDAWPWAPSVHLLIFLHRVDGLRPGLYAFMRRGDALDTLKAMARNDLEWLPVQGAPAHFQLRRLAEGNCQQLAATLSCQQAIAGDSSFSLGMLAEFDAALTGGSWHYRRLFWECGLIGQALYLEAEAAGVRGTGIGCYFDDPVLEVLGLAGTTYQSLYHFTIGGPITDTRLDTLPPYGHVQR